MRTTSDNETTKFQNEENEYTVFDNENAISNAEHAEENRTTGKSAEADTASADNNGNWKQVAIGGISGILMGATTTILMGMKKHDDPIDPAKDKPDHTDETTTRPSWAIGEFPIASSVTDSMSFSEAFAAARTEVGPGGAFEWHGNVYSTYRAEEWNAMTPQERNEFNSHFSWNHHSTSNTAHHTTNHQTGGHSHREDSSGNGNAVSQQPTNQTTPQSNNDDIEVVSVKPENPSGQYTPGPSQTDNTNNPNGQEDHHNPPSPEVTPEDKEIQVLGVSHDMDTNMNIGELYVGGHEAVVIDVDGDMTFDMLIVDANDDGEIQDNECTDIRATGLTVDDLGGITSISGNNVDSDPIEDIDYNIDMA